MVAYKREKKFELLTTADPYNIINNVDDEMYTYVPCKKRCDSCTNFVVAKSSFECFATQRVYKVRQSTSCVSKNVIYIAFGLNCLKQGVGTTVDWKPRLQNYKSHIEKKCDLVALLTTLLMFVVTQMIPQEILDLLLLINYIIQTVFPLMVLTIYCYTKKDFGFQRLPPYMKYLIAHMTGIENVVQNTLNKNRTYDN